MNKLYTAVLLLLLAITQLSCGSSRRTLTVEEGWELLGEMKVDFARDKDKLEVSSVTNYTAIRFKVEKRDVKIKDLKVVYANLDKLEPAIDEEIKADQYSKVIELGQEGKLIRSIEFRYRTTGNLFKGRGNVLVFGRRYGAAY